jgi:hypothetical protein
MRLSACLGLDWKIWGIMMLASQKDAVFDASIEFIETLSGMKSPPIETAPPEVFEPFRVFTEKVCSIFSKNNLVTQPVPAQVEAEVVRELYEALKPFAGFDLRGNHLVSRDDNQPVFYARDETVLTVGDFKKANAALTKAKEHGL